MGKKINYCSDGPMGRHKGRGETRTERWKNRWSSGEFE